MAVIYSSTLLEVHTHLNNIVFRILNKMMPDFWKENKQVVYSSVDEWDTAYRSYLDYNKIEEVKFPFATITRETTQVTQRPWSEPIRLVDRRQAISNPAGVLVKQCHCDFNLTLYEKQLGTLEMFSDFIIAQGWETQRVDYISEVLGAPSRFSFIFGEPTHSIIADKNNRYSENGHIYSVTIPIKVDTVLGIQTQEKLITEIVACINDQLSEAVLEVVTVEGEPDAQPIDESET
jgi:hypothetical protein